MGQSLLICNKAQALVKKYQTRNPFDLMYQMGVEVFDQPKLTTLKGYCTIMNRIPYVVINANLDDITKKIVAAHELGHLLLHRKELRQEAPLFDNMLYETNITEAEANLFAADLLISDEDVFSVCLGSAPDIYTMAKTLDTMPELLNIKIASMQKRGYDIKPPLMQGSQFL